MNTIFAEYCENARKNSEYHRKSGIFFCFYENKSGNQKKNRILLLVKRKIRIMRIIHYYQV